jgi:hypothetical protein
VPQRRIWTEAGVFRPEEMDLLGRVFERTWVADESDQAREQRASRILAYFQAGITDEDELCELARKPLGR